MPPVDHPDTAPAHRWRVASKWNYLYYTLAILYVVATAASLVTQRRVEREYNLRFQEAKFWHERFRSYDEIDRVASAIRDSSGSALVSGGFGSYWTNVQRFRRDCNQQ